MEVYFTAAPGLPVGDLAAALGIDTTSVTEEHPGEYLVRASATPALIADLACWMRDRGVVIGTLQAGRALSRRGLPADHRRAGTMRVGPVVAQARVELALTLRRGESLIVTLAIPLGILVFFGKVETLDTSYDDPLMFLVPGVLALAVMSAAMVSLGIATGFERRYGVLKRLGSTPLTRGGLLVAKSGAILALEVVQAVAIVATGVALGWSMPGGAAEALPLILLGTLAFAGIGMFLAGTLRAEANLALANGLFLVLMFLGGMAYPLDELPGAVQDLARILPAAALSECLRGVLTAGEAFPWGSLAVLGVWAVVGPALAARWFRWED